jgi:hypothetical protein
MRVADDTIWWARPTMKRIYRRWGFGVTVR